MNDNIIDTHKRELRISLTFDAPRELVWKASIEPERMKMWWGPETFTTPFVKIDFQVGGKYLVCMRSPDNKDFWSSGSYLEIDPYKKLAMTDSFADENGNVVSASFYGMSSDFPIESRVEFNGNGREAMSFYQDCFGGDLYAGVKKKSSPCLPGCLSAGKLNLLLGRRFLVCMPNWKINMGLVGSSNMERVKSNIKITCYFLKAGCTID